MIDSHGIVDKSLFIKAKDLIGRRVGVGKVNCKYNFPWLIAITIRTEHIV